MTTNSHPGRRGADLLSVERLLGLSDNVVAFAVTATGTVVVPA